eukprot:m.151004 g.151004  ORF g.151004 m.151004 type:complete len:222 (+) comp11692_c0_seq3:389-1054(+)
MRSGGTIAASVSWACVVTRYTSRVLESRTVVDHCSRARDRVDHAREALSDYFKKRGSEVQPNKAVPGYIAAGDVVLHRKMSQVTVVYNDGTAPQHALPAQSEQAVTTAPTNPKVQPQPDREPDDDNDDLLFKARLVAVIAKDTPNYYVPDYAVRKVVALLDTLFMEWKEGACGRATVHVKPSVKQRLASILGDPDLEAAGDARATTLFSAFKYHKQRQAMK